MVNGCDRSLVVINMIGQLGRSSTTTILTLLFLLPCHVNSAHCKIPKVKFRVQQTKEEKLNLPCSNTTVMILEHFNSGVARQDPTPY